MCQKNYRMLQQKSKDFYYCNFDPYFEHAITILSMANLLWRIKRTQSMHLKELETQF